MIYAVIGSRGFDNYQKLKEILDQLPDVKALVSGGAKGADKLAERYAEERNLNIYVYEPEWYVNGKYDRTAGFKRNTTIIEKADKIIAFWDMESKGTKNSIDTARKLGKKVLVVSYLTNCLKVYA